MAHIPHCVCRCIVGNHGEPARHRPAEPSGLSATKPTRHVNNDIIFVRLTVLHARPFWLQQKRETNYINVGAHNFINPVFQKHLPSRLSIKNLKTSPYDVALAQIQLCYVNLPESDFNIKKKQNPSFHQIVTLNCSTICTIILHSSV